MKLLNRRKFNFEELDLKTCIATNHLSKHVVFFFIYCNCKNGGSWAMYEVFESGYALEIPPTGRVFKNYIVSLISTYK